MPSPAPSLIVENILKALEGVKDRVEQARWLGIRHSSSLKDTVEQFLQGRGNYQPSWRAVIFGLDGAGETPLASRIRSYGEPVQGKYTCTTCIQYVCQHNSVGCSTIYTLYYK